MMKCKKLCYIIMQLLFVLSIYNCNYSSPYQLIEEKKFDCLYHNKQIKLYTIQNSNGMIMQVTNFGARVVSLWVKDKKGQFNDIVLGYNDINQYINNEGERFLGAAIGRFANRIANGTFTLFDSVYMLPRNNNGHTLHGGEQSFDMSVWSVDSMSSNKIIFNYFSCDGEEGFPGNLNVKMIYELTDNDEFVISYFANTDKPTHINLTHHSFFNLKGEGCGTINDHILYINADYYTPIDSTLIPLGSIENVKNSPFDFTVPKPIGKELDLNHTQLINAKGYDHNFVINRATNDSLELAAIIYEPNSGREMQVWTTEPGIQFYGGNFFNGHVAGKSQNKHDFRGAFALETQRFPDSPNQNQYPSTVLMPGEIYKHICKYKFLTKTIQ